MKLSQLDLIYKHGLKFVLTLGPINMKHTITEVHLSTFLKDLVKILITLYLFLIKSCTSVFMHTFYFQLVASALLKTPFIFYFFKFYSAIKKIIIIMPLKSNEKKLFFGPCTRIRGHIDLI